MSGKAIIIYYFSGTGNSLQVAEWFREYLSEKYSVELVNISEKEKVKTADPNSMVGFISPVHGFNYPPIMLNFIFRFPRTKFKAKVFLMNTRAGMKMGKFFVPGLSGLTFWLSSMVLYLKGYRIVGLQPIDMPSNWLLLHPTLSNKVIQSIFDRCKVKTEVFAEKISSQQKSYKAAKEVIQDIIITPISVLYYLMGRFILAKSLYADSRCNQCNICISQCPVKAIKQVNGQPFWTIRCESCMKCINRCPKRSIQVGHGYLLTIIFAAYATAIAWISHHLYPLISFKHESIFWKLGTMLVEGVIILTLLAIGYRIIHFLKNKIPVSQLLNYTSFTTFKFWGRYKGIRTKK